MTDHTNIAAPLLRDTALLGVLVLITCHQGAAAGSV
jgi:hypothetical protein